MRVMQIMAGASRGGAETFFVSLATALARAGLDQRAVIRSNPQRAAALDLAGVPTAQAPFGGHLDLATGRILRREAAAFRPDAVLAWMQRAAAFMPEGPFLKLGRLGGYYDVKHYRRCDHLLCITPAIVEHVVARGWPRERAHYMPNFAEAEPGRAVDRGDLGTPEDAPLVLGIGRLHRNKGFDVLLRALALEPRAHLWLAGAGPQRAALERLSEQLGLSERVRFLGWRVDRGALFAAADLCVFPSRYEPFGTVSLEAWAYRVPLVAADADGPAGLVHPEEDAILVPREDPEALARAIARVIDQPELAGRQVEAGARHHAAEFTEAACVERYLRLFRHLLEHRAAAERERV